MMCVCGNLISPYTLFHVTLIQVFTICDPEGKGYITRDTLSKFCNRRNSVLDSIMSTLDHDKDGKISFDEFREGFEVRRLKQAHDTVEPL